MKELYSNGSFSRVFIVLQKLKDVQSYARIPPSINQVRSLCDYLVALLSGYLPFNLPAYQDPSQME